MEDFTMNGGFVTGILNFGLYLGTALAVCAVFIYVYTHLTPYKELELIRSGNAAAACSLGGAIIGFVLPVASVIANSVGVIDVVIWSLVAMAIQILLFVVIWKRFSDIVTNIHEGQISSGIFLGALSIAIGIVNASCLTY